MIFPYRLNLFLNIEINVPKFEYNQLLNFFLAYTKVHAVKND